jgi:hypothetical protein
MRRLLALPLILALGAPAAAQSLGEMAEKEKAKKKDPKAKTFTDKDLEKRRPPQEPTPSPAPGGRTTQGTRRSTPTAGVPNVYEGMTPDEIEEAKKAGGARREEGPAADSAGAEAVWRKRMQEAHEAIDVAEKQVGELQAKYTALAQDLNPNPEDIADPMRQFKLDDRKRETLAELEAAKAKVAAKKQALADLEDEARRKNVPPGWLR